MTGVSSADWLLTPEELAERWQVVSDPQNAEQIFRMVRNGEIPRGAVVYLGSTIRFRLKGIEAFEAEGGCGHREAAGWLGPWRASASAWQRSTITTASEGREMLILNRRMSAIAFVGLLLSVFAVIGLVPSLLLFALVAAGLLPNYVNARKRDR